MLCMNVIKRNGQEVVFDKKKIVNAISKANNEVKQTSPNYCIDTLLIEKIAGNLERKYQRQNRSQSVEDIQDDVELELLKNGAFIIAREYIRYRYKRSLLRKSNTTDEAILSLISCENEEIKQENSNKNPVIASTQRDYMAGEVSKDLTRRFFLPEHIVKAHDLGIIHFHDADYFAQKIHNCDLINLEDMLQNGTVISGTMIEKPHSFSTACNIATQIIAQVASSQYGGQSITLSHLAPFVDVSRQKIKNNVLKEFIKISGKEPTTENELKKFNEIVEEHVLEEVKKGVQTIQYQIVTLMTTNGQAPFVTVFACLSEVEDKQTKSDLALIIEEVFKQRYQGVKNEKGVYITPAFPKLIYALDEDNIYENSPYFYLTYLAVKCSVKRLVPDYISVKKMKELKIDSNGIGQCYPSMGCRSFLTPWVDENNKPKYYGRFNQGVVTINLVDAGLSANKDLNKFWEILNERVELCHEALQCRHNRLHGTKSDIAPILWQYGALARLEKGQTIDHLLHGGYSTISLGYAGLWECVYSLIGKKLTETEGKELGKQILKKLNDYCFKWREQENIHYSLYGTPLETTVYKFAKCLQKRFGIIKGVTDKNYITNSYHVHVTENIDAFSKLALESEFQELSPGGAISYVESPDLQGNLDAAVKLVQFIYDNIMYAEINSKSDYCQNCGYDGEIKIIEDENGKLIWKCPNCGNTDQNKMNVARRT